MKNEQVVLARRPRGKPVVDDFAVVQGSVGSPGDRETLVRNLYISLDAGFRNWMDEGAGDEVLPAMPIGEPVMGLTLGRVEQSNHPDLPKGTLLMGRLAWEEYSITTDDHFIVPLDQSMSGDKFPLHYHLGILGDTGMSAYFGLKDVAQVQAGDTVLISAAGGAVGSIAGQVARIFGAGRVVGFAGNDEKCTRLEQELGYDRGINYRAGDVEAGIRAACPDGVDVYFDNVGGPLLEPVLNNINHGARIAFCGAVADYTRDQSADPARAPAAPANLFRLVTQCARLQGFLTHTQVDRYDEARAQLLAWVDAGVLKSHEHFYDGVAACGQAFSDLFAGVNFGKTIVRIADES